MRRRILFDRKKNKGDIVNLDDLRFRRAYKGIFPSQIYRIMGKNLIGILKKGKA